MFVMFVVHVVYNMYATPPSGHLSEYALYHRKFHFGPNSLHANSRWLPRGAHLAPSPATADTERRRPRHRAALRPRPPKPTPVAMTVQSTHRVRAQHARRDHSAHLAWTTQDTCPGRSLSPLSPLTHAGCPVGCPAERGAQTLQRRCDCRGSCLRGSRGAQRPPGPRPRAGDAIS